MPRSKSKLYIAYGSNLNLEQMKHRCPTAKVVGKSELPGWKMTFRGSSGGVATIERDADSSVPVLVWRIYPQDEASLDIYEGAPRFYRKETMPVKLKGKTVNAMIYIMNDGHSLCRPSMGYYHTILSGYRSAGFDEQILDGFVNNNGSDEPAKDDGGEQKLMTAKIREQIMAIRDSGETNMFDTRTVQYLAFQRNYYELVCFIEDHSKEYVRFILTGEEV